MTDDYYSKNGIFAHSDVQLVARNVYKLRNSTFFYPV